MNKVDDLIGAGVKNIQDASTSELKEFKRLNNLSKDDIAPYIMVNDAITRPDVSESFKQGGEFMGGIMEELGTNALKNLNIFGGSGGDCDKPDVGAAPADAAPADATSVRTSLPRFE